MAVDLAQVREQVERQRARRSAEAPPVKLEMEMCGQRHMVLQRDRHDFEQLGYRFVGPYIEGKAAPVVTPAKASKQES